MSKLKHSYEKLQRKNLKEAREGALSRDEDRTELSCLKSKLEVQRLAQNKAGFIFVYIALFNHFSSSMFLKFSEHLFLWLQEFRQHSSDWEQQRLHYQRQVSSLEEQRKNLWTVCTHPGDPLLIFMEQCNDPLDKS